jgi:hypothetical protein
VDVLITLRWISSLSKHILSFGNFTIWKWDLQMLY